MIRGEKRICILCQGCMAGYASYRKGTPIGTMSMALGTKRIVLYNNDKISVISK